MRLLLFTLVAVHCGIALAERPPAPAPTEFEALAGRPSAEPILSRHLGSIRSADAEVSVTALHLRDAERPSSHMLGVRFDLVNNAGTDRVFLDLEQLAAVRRELHDIEMGVPRLERDDSAPYRVQGTGACWNPNPNVRILCPDYYVGPDGAGMRLGALGGRRFEFPGHRPSELIELIDRARELLRE